MLIDTEARGEIQRMAKAVIDGMEEIAVGLEISGEEWKKVEAEALRGLLERDLYVGYAAAHGVPVAKGLLAFFVRQFRPPMDFSAICQDWPIRLAEKIGFGDLLGAGEVNSNRLGSKIGLKIIHNERPFTATLQVAFDNARDNCHQSGFVLAYTPR